MTHILTKAVNRVMELWAGPKKVLAIGKTNKAIIARIQSQKQTDIDPGTYLTRGGRRVEYLGAGEGRFLPYGLRTRGWLPFSGRWLTSGEDHAYDLIERIKTDE